jgi:hypothetical protein
LIVCAAAHDDPAERRQKGGVPVVFSRLVERGKPVHRPVRGGDGAVPSPATRDQRLAEKAFQKRPACSRVRCIAWFGLLGLSLAGLPHSSVTVSLDHGQHLQTICVHTVIDDIREAPQSRRTHVPPDDAMYLGDT